MSRTSVLDPDDAFLPDNAVVVDGDGRVGCVQMGAEMDVGGKADGEGVGSCEGGEGVEGCGWVEGGGGFGHLLFCVGGGWGRVRFGESGTALGFVVSVYGVNR